LGFRSFVISGAFYFAFMASHDYKKQEQQKEVSRIAHEQGY